MLLRSLVLRRPRDSIRLCYVSEPTRCPLHISHESPHEPHSSLVTPLSSPLPPLFHILSLLPPLLCHRAVAMSSSKYIVENGKVKLNPNFGNPNKPTTVANPQRALVVPSNIDEANAITDLTGSQLAPSTLDTVVAVQDDGYVNQFHSGGRVDGGELMDTISRIFTEMEAPIGLAHKLIALQGYAINIKIDDSGSMGSMCNNGYTRWVNLQQRLIQLMRLLQVVPTRDVTLSFLDRRDIINIPRHGGTPEQFYAYAQQVINGAFQRPPGGGTPIYASVCWMLQNARGPTAHFLFTDGLPSDSRYTAEQEIKLTQDVLLGRANPMQNPFTLACCSDLPTDTLWMHEIEEEACRPGRPGFVAALQNFRSEQLEVLNDQGPEFPYSNAMWLLCSLTAAMNPNDLDALDQHAPLSKPTLDNIIGHVTTPAEYESYFNSHPQANWLFAEDYNAFLTADIANRIPAVNAFDTWLAQQLQNDINMGDDTSEFRAIAKVEQALLSQYRRSRPDNLFRARLDFWNNHCLSMELQQTRFYTSGGRAQATQTLWDDYLVSSGMVPSWQWYIQQCRSSRGSAPSTAATAASAPTGAAPPTYADATGQQYSSAPVQQQQQYSQQQQQQQQQPAYSNPQYYNGYIARGTVNQQPQWTSSVNTGCCSIQ